MADKKVHLKIITPREIKVDEHVDMVIMRCTTGDMGVLYGHEPCSAALDDGIMRIKQEDEERHIAVFGGLAEVRDNTVTVLTGDAKWPEDVDLESAEHEREAAEERLKERSDDVMIQRHQVLLRRALVKIEVSSYPIISKPE